MSVYDNMQFPPYVFVEYPKWVGNDVRAEDPNNPGNYHGTGVLVANREEEEAFWRSLKNEEAPVKTEVDTKKGK